MSRLLIAVVTALGVAGLGACAADIGKGKGKGKAPPPIVEPAPPPVFKG